MLNLESRGDAGIVELPRRKTKLNAYTWSGIAIYVFD